MSTKLRIGLCVIGLFAGQAYVSGQVNNDGFELVRNEDSILVHERWVTFPGSDPPVTAREVKSEFFIRGNMHDALSLIQDESKIGVWQKHVTEFRVYPHADSLWYEYSYHDIPWPVSDQDHFLEYTIHPSKPGEGIFITFRSVRNDRLAPERKGVSRMTLSGSWRFEEVDGGQIKATYRILSMPGNLPRFLTDPVIRNNLMSTVRAYIQTLEAGYVKR